MTQPPVPDGMGRLRADLRQKRGQVLAAAALLFFIDQATKAATVAWVAPGTVHPIVGFALTWTRVQNTGAAFSLFPGSAMVLALVAAAVAGAVFLFGHRLPSAAGRIGAGLLLGGAMGNGLDRLVEGWVVDFLRIPVWPVFNFADVGVSVGAVLVVIALANEGPRTVKERAERS